MPDEQSEPSAAARIGELEHQGELDRKTIADLEQQGVTDRHKIAGLEQQGVTDRHKIAGLQDQGVVDQDIIVALLEQGAVDRAEIANLQEALVTARRIGAAMGVLMSSRKLTQEAAFDVLRDRSQRTHRKLRDIAEDVLLTGTIDG